MLHFDLAKMWIFCSLLCNVLKNKILRCILTTCVVVYINLQSSGNTYFCHLIHCKCYFFPNSPLHVTNYPMFTKITSDSRETFHNDLPVYATLYHEQRPCTGQWHSFHPLWSTVQLLCSQTTNMFILFWVWPVEMCVTVKYLGPFVHAYL